LHKKLINGGMDANNARKIAMFIIAFISSADLSSASSRAVSALSVLWTVIFGILALRLGKK
jgi:hypothetical protein